MSLPLSIPIFRAFDHSTGAPLAGGKLFSFYAGSSTPLGTFTDATLGTPNANPTILDANGEAIIFPNPTLSYKFILQNAAGVVQWTIDGFSVTSTAATASATNAGKNLVTEGDFTGWQEKQTYVLGAAASVVSDCWACRVASGTPGHFTVSQQSAALPNGLSSALRFQRNVGQTDAGSVTVCHNIEPYVAQEVQGQFLTLSYWMQCGANFSGGLAPIVSIRSGSAVYEGWQNAGLYSGEQVLASQAKALTTSWQQFFLVTPIVVPVGSVSELGVMFGADLSGTGTGYNFSGTAGANDWFQIARVQLEVGTTVSAFEILTDLEDLTRRQRRYFKTFPPGINPVQNPATTLFGALRFTQPVAAATLMKFMAQHPYWQQWQQTPFTPVLTTYNPLAANAQMRNVTRANDCTLTGANSDINNVVLVNATSSAGSAAGDENAIHLTIDKRF